MTGIHLRRGEENAAAIDALAALLGGRVGLDGILGDLRREARTSLLGRLLGRAVDTAYSWDRPDERDRRWWPQGISSSADSGSGVRRRVLAVTWYAKDLGTGSHGSRVTFLDLDTLRYEHVLLAVPTLDAAGRAAVEPLRVHAGGLAWCGPHLHVAATRRGLVSCHVDDLMRANGDGVESFGHRYVLPVRLSYGAHSAEHEEPFRFSFLSVDRTTGGPGLVAGEYGGPGATRRLIRFDLAESGLPIDHDGIAHPTYLAEHGATRMQGVVAVRGRHHVTSSHGTLRPGSVHVGTPGALHERRWALPMGPEDLAYWPETDRLWSLTEHPYRRWVVSMRRSWFE